MTDETTPTSNTITLPDGSIYPKQSFNSSDVINNCLVYATQLKVIEGVDPKILMLAIASVESSLGADCGPRHEPAYDKGGSVWSKSAIQRKLISDCDSGAACSFGPWQMMFDNFDDGFTLPNDLVNGDPELLLNCYARAFIEHFNTYVMHFKPTTITEVGEIWNEGHIAPDPAYVVKLQAAYATCTILVANLVRPA